LRPTLEIEAANAAPAERCDEARHILRTFPLRELGGL